MRLVTLKAHYDGERIRLDEPFDLPLNSALIVTVLPSLVENERASWEQAAAAGLAGAYSEDEPEYSPDDVKS